MEYTEKNGTYYNADAAPDMIDLLERLRASATRVRFHWGDTKTGKDWGDIYDVSGHISRSTGTKKIPILIHNSRSMGGGAILDNCIIGIKHSKGGQILYRWKK